VYTPRKRPARFIRHSVKPSQAIYKLPEPKFEAELPKDHLLRDLKRAINGSKGLAGNSDK